MSPLSGKEAIEKRACAECGASPGVRCILPPGQIHMIRMLGAIYTRPRTKSQKFYATEDWRRVRYSALKRANGKCECCGAGPATGSVLHVDHIKPKSKHPRLALDPSNLQVLCEDCNMGKGSHDETDWRPR